MLTEPSSQDSDPGLVELIRFSSKALLRKEFERSRVKQGNSASKRIGHRAVEQDQTGSLDAKIHTDYVATAMPLRERDLEVLADLFRQDKIDEMEADVLNNLLRRYPEPCWEDNPMEFLKEHL
jgi:hypothetical protein